MRDTRKLVYVSGAPGSGKSTLAVPLAAELGYALLRKDRIKETLHDALGAPEPDRVWSRRLGAAAMELLWALAALCEALDCQPGDLLRWEPEAAADEDPSFQVPPELVRPVPTPLPGGNFSHMR